MNFKLIAFSSLITALIGAVLGYAVGNVFQPKFNSKISQNLNRQYAVVGGIAGLVTGGCQEAIRQLKQQRDEEEVNEKGGNEN